MFKNIQITNNYHLISKLNILLNISKKYAKNVLKNGIFPQNKGFSYFLITKFCYTWIKMLTYPIFHKKFIF